METRKHFIKAIKLNWVFSITIVANQSSAIILLIILLVNANNGYSFHSNFYAYNDNSDDLKYAAV